MLSTKYSVGSIISKQILWCTISTTSVFNGRQKKVFNVHAVARKEKYSMDNVVLDTSHEKEEIENLSAMEDFINRKGAQTSSGYHHQLETKHLIER